MNWDEIIETSNAASFEPHRDLFANQVFWDSEVDILMNTASLLRNKKFFDDALWLLAESDRRNLALPGQAKYLRADLLLDIGRYAEAIECYTEILKETKNEVAYGNRALAYWGCGEYGAALQDYLRAVELNPRNAIVLRGAGEMYLETGRPDLAVPCLLSALEQKPDYSDAFTALGTARCELGELDSAYKCFKKAVSLNPEDSAAKRGVERIEKHFGI